MLKIHVFTLNPIQENTIIISADNGDCCIIDPGCYSHNEKAFVDGFLKKNNFKPVLLINTHTHIDHVMGLDWAAKTYQLTPQFHELDQPLFERASMSAEKWGLSYTHYEGPVQYLKEGDEIKLGDDILKVLFVPGHAPGHVCFYNATQGFLIAGDTLFKHSIGRTDLPYCNHDDLIKYIHSELLTLPDDTLVYPGHGPTTTIGEEKKSNPFLK